MSKFKINTTLNYSPNFDLKKRKPQQIKFIIFHYTGMRKEKDAIKKLTNNTSKVSSHYLIKNNGKILTLVPDLYVAWHAGVSQWKNFTYLNKHSLGIEISNPGHEHNYKEFSKEQIKAVINLSLYLKKKYKIKKEFILGHSDISPTRKKDPGEKFPWEYLSKKKICYWHNLNKNKISKYRNLVLNKFEKKLFINNIVKIGYLGNSYKKSKINIEFNIQAFQRRFRPALINGIIDKECLIISTNIAKKLK
tara:strand:+ start:520 stop:1266 length:747 start_codon:yes stop_codon:yes gene_type:complete